MRSKLQKFAEFANLLLPLEADYLLSVQRFEDVERAVILQAVSDNCRKVRDWAPYDENLDKRKYSNLKNWIEERLNAIDVDRQYAWLGSLEASIMTDAIRPDEEKELLRLFRQSAATMFNFLKLYDVGRVYRHFLLVRMRYEEHRILSAFLEKNAEAYTYAREVNDKLHEATADIVAQYSGGGKAESMHWEQWLSAVFFNEGLDGYNRILALVRLIFIAYNYRRFDLLPDKFDRLEQLFRAGQMYSKRILLNFYSQKLLACARAHDFDQAAYFGYLSVRAQNSDHLYYVNNFAAVLLRKQQAAEALRVLREALPEARASQNFHNKIGHAAYITMALNQLGQYRQAETHAKTFFDAYKKEVFEHRWQLFFNTWLEALLRQEQGVKVLKVAQTNQLAKRDAAYRESPNYTPALPWILALATWQAGKSTDGKLAEELMNFMESGAQTPEKNNMTDLVELAAALAPEVMGAVRKRL
ncbi:MAG: hypothetical protein IT270_19825 [Saprospiraceae bacterium]|nr:hypothetical protein [Saprospiraceae bacterium]